MTEIKPIHTACRDCCFADFEDNTQDGCLLGLIHRYKNLGVEIVEAYDEEGMEFSIINGRFCKFKRSMGWYSTKTSPYIDVLNECAPRIEYFIYTDDDSYKNLHDTLDSIRTQTIKPKAINIINNGVEGRVRLAQKELEAFGVAWSIQDIVEEDADMDRCVDIACKGCKSTYMLVCRSGMILPVDFTLKLDHLVTIELKQVAYVEFEKDFYMTHLLGYRSLFGGRGQSYQSKVRENIPKEACYYEWK